MTQKDKEGQVLTMQEAMASLSVIAQLDIRSEKMIGVVKDHKFVLSGQEHSYQSVYWLTAETAEEIFEQVEKVYQTILDYLQQLYEDSEVDWENPELRASLQSIMALVIDAASKLDQYNKEFLRSQNVTSIIDSRLYKKIQEFFLEKLSTKLDVPLEGSEAWEEDWDGNGNAFTLDLEKSGFKDFESVKQDKDYEFFYLKNEAGKSYFTPELLRNIKLFCGFDEMQDLPMDEDPLIIIRSMQDKDLHGGAQQIIHGAQKEIHDFFKLSAKEVSNPLYHSLNRSIMALMLCANPRNLIQNTYGKSSILYFSDFQKFLRESLISDEYKKLIAYPPEETDKSSLYILRLAHRLCFEFFQRRSAIKEEMIGFIHRLIRIGTEIQKEENIKVYKTSSVDEFLLGDDAIRALLKCYPNGPLFKIIDLLRSEEVSEEETVFCPIFQENLPRQLFQLEVARKKMAFNRLPCPTRQKTISKAEILEEFIGLLRYLQNADKNYLLINLQDRGSWKESARCLVLEKQSMQAEFNKELNLVTIAKNTDFYFQVDAYQNIDGAKEFMLEFFKQVENAEENGFYFGKLQKEKEFKKIIDFVHEVFFEKKKKLERAERLDFIEICYQFLFLKLIEWQNPDYVSFVCKDAIDTSAVAIAGFYLFVSLLMNGKITKEDKDNFYWLSYMAAFIVRERSVDSQKLNRIVSMLAHLDDKLSSSHKKVRKELEELFDPKWLKGMKIIS